MKFWLENIKRDNFEDLGTDGRIALKCILKKCVKECTGFI
jgi:hypothetical protein